MRKMSFLLTASYITCIFVLNAQENKKPPQKLPKVNLTKFNPPQPKKRDNEINAFYRRNPSISYFYRGAKNKIFIKLKNGNKEEYDLSNEVQKKRFEEIYGTSPTPPLPAKKSKQKMRKLTPPKIKEVTIV